jgi:hypothetical protein
MKIREIYKGGGNYRSKLRIKFKGSARRGKRPNCNKNKRRRAIRSKIILATSSPTIT